MEINKNQNISDVYSDIIAIKINPTNTFEEAMNMFYAVMLKHNIKQGEWCDDEKKARTMCNGEWVMCYEVFKSVVINAFFMWQGVIADPPNELLAY